MCAAETTADSTATCWVQEVAALQVKVYQANSRASGAETSLAAAQAKEQDLVEKLARKHANQEKLQAQVCSLASQLNAARASSRQVGVCCTTIGFACRFLFLFMSSSARTHLKTQLVQAAVRHAETEWVLSNKFTNYCFAYICNCPACCSWSLYRMFASLVHMAVAVHCP